MKRLSLKAISKASKKKSPNVSSEVCRPRETMRLKRKLDDQGQEAPRFDEKIIYLDQHKDQAQKDYIDKINIKSI